MTSRRAPSPRPAGDDEKPWIFKSNVRKPNEDKFEEKELDLNALVGNKDGHFHQPGKNFIASATNIRRERFALHADLRDRNGEYQHRMLNLEQCLSIDKAGSLTCSLDRSPNHLPVPFCDTSSIWPGGTWKKDKWGIRLAQSEFIFEFRALLQDIEKAIDRNTCPVCHLIKGIANHLAKEDPRYAYPDTEILAGQHREGLTFIHFEFAEHRKSHEVQRYVLYTREDAPCESSTFAPIQCSKHIITDPTSDRSIARARSWIDECVRNHTKCTSGTANPILPYRVLDLGGGNAEAVQLIVADGRKGDYVCLSYSWGDAVGAQLTEDNIDHFQQGVEIASMPKTYRDAIAFCRRLSLRYLWIDALCIMQNNAADWGRESAKMAEYYGRSYLCVSATSSRNLDVGCDGRLAPVELKGKGRDNKPYNLYLRPQFRHFTQDQYYKERANYFPVLDRAWCYQERRLATRVLHFTGQELFLECAEMTACECGETSEESGSAWTKNKEAFYVQHLDISSEKHEHKRIQYEWFAHVNAFSGLNITRVSDRLPAISGLAKRHKETMTRLGIASGRYLAGIWEQQLIDGLSWCVGKDLSHYRREGDKLILSAREGPLTGSISVDAGKSWKRYWKEGLRVSMNPTDNKVLPQMEKPREYVAPSWSWASVRDPVTYNTPFSTPLCSVVNVDITPANSEAPFGQIQPGASITLRGKVRKSHWNLIQPEDKRPYWALTDLPGFADREHMKWFPDYQFDDLADELFLMPLTSRALWQNRPRIAKWLLSSGTLTVYLVLQHRNDNTYERVGWTFTRSQEIEMDTKEEVGIKVL